MKGTKPEMLGMDWIENVCVEKRKRKGRKEVHRERGELEVMDTKADIEKERGKSRKKQKKR